jgi:hypothetical protein
MFREYETYQRVQFFSNLYKGFQILILPAEILPFKSELSIKFTGFTETTFFCPCFRTFAPGAEHPQASWIRRAVFANAGLKMMIRTTYPIMSSIFVSGFLYNVRFSLSRLFHLCCRIIVIISTFVYRIHAITLCTMATHDA